MWLSWIVVAVVSIYVFLSRLLPWIIARIVSLYLAKATVRIGGFSRRLEAHSLHLVTGNIEVAIDKLRLSSSIFNSEASNLLTLIATGVTVSLKPEKPYISDTVRTDRRNSERSDSEEEDSTGPESPPSQGSGRLLMLAQFLGLQLVHVQVVIGCLPSLPCCQLVLELGEVRLDSSVIHHTKLSLALHLYQGRLVLRPRPGLDSQPTSPLMEASFAFQTNVQALVANNRLTSIEDVGLDIDSPSFQLSSSLFQHLTHGRGKVAKKPKKEKGGLDRLVALVPKQVQVKMEQCTVNLEHTDKVSQVEAQLKLLYVSFKCNEVARIGCLPDSHLTGQLSGLHVVVPGYTGRPIMELARFQVLVQKESSSVHTDTQIHEARCHYCGGLNPWLAPISWFVNKMEHQPAEVTKPKPSWLTELAHHHQLDAWNSELSISEEMTPGCSLSLNHLVMSSVPGPVTSLSAQQLRLIVDQQTVLNLGQFDTRLCKKEKQQNVDLMVSGAVVTYTTEVTLLAERVRDIVRPLMLQYPPPKSSPSPAPSWAIVVSQTKMVWVGQQSMGLAFELREVEARGQPVNCDMTATGLKFSLLGGSGTQLEEQLTILQLPSVNLVKKGNDLKVAVSQKVRLNWKPSLHMVLLTCKDEFKQVASFMPLNKKESTPIPSEPLILHLNISDRVTIFVTTGKNEARLTISSTTAKHAPGSLSWLQAPSVTVRLSTEDQHYDVVSCKDLVLSLVPHSDKLTAERRRMEGAEVMSNSCIVVAINQLAVTAPYEYDLHDVVLGEMVGVVKWLKMLHKKEKNPDSVEKLPKDLLLNVKQFKFELTDDPFEVKLRDNYELKEDEYLESMKRFKLFEDRIEGIRRDNFMFPDEKLQELLEALKKKNTDIYIQRAKNLNRGGKGRTRLLEWEMTSVEIMLLADPSMQGQEKIVRHLMDCDRESPWPPVLQFTTLWCRWIRVMAANFVVNLRDFPQHMIDLQTMILGGRLAGAEVAPSKRAVRLHRVSVDQPFHDVMVERSLVPLKFYYDLLCDTESLSIAYGSCWEPAMTQCSIAMQYLTGRTSVDPSTPLPWWDKTRLLMHGRLLIAVRSFQLLLHASLDPYNTTEEMEIRWTDLELDWEEAMVGCRGTLDIYVRTASKYDDGHLLHFPSLSLTLKFGWECLANPLDHHSVMLCAPDKLPEYSHNQEHDSFRAFRSSNLNITINLETKGARGSRSILPNQRPKLDMFSSTLRWFENLKFIFSGASRPIRRGAQFRNKRPLKPTLSRHFKRCTVSMALHQFQVNYWTSFSQQRGILLNVARGISLSAEWQLQLTPYTDGLKRRSKAEYAVTFINCELATSDIWIQSAVVQSDDDEEDPPPSPSPDPPPSTPASVRATLTPTSTSTPSLSGRDTLSGKQENSRNMERSFLFCVEKVVYMRMGQSYVEEEKPTHKLVIHGARGAYTQSNRDMGIALYDSWRRAQILRKNVSSDALKSFHVESATPVQQEKTPFTSPTPQQNHTSGSPYSWSGVRAAGSMLDKLLADSEGGATPTVYSEDQSECEEVKHNLEAKAACTQEDIVQMNWSIELVNSQVLLKGIESKGYVIMSAAKASVCQNRHRPVWKERALLSKTTWSGALENMQYYATVSEQGGADLDNIMWLTVDNIVETEEYRVPGPAGLVGSGRAVGGVVSQVVGLPSSDSPTEHGIQLQRIVSRCKAEFFYVSYGDTALDELEANLVSGVKLAAPPLAEGAWAETETAVNAFSLVHHDLNVVTNSLQFTMVVDILNNLLLYTEPTMKAATDRYLRMRYQFMLESDKIEDQRKTILSNQNKLRHLTAQLRQREKDIYLLSAEDPRRLEWENEAAAIKDNLFGTSEELDMMIRCYKETQMSSNQRRGKIMGEDGKERLRRKSEICFRQATWTLNEVDGQIGISVLNISNFIFTRSSMSDDSIENIFEMGYIHCKNLIPNQKYQNILKPTELQRDMPVDRQRAVRVYIRERARVGGISVKDHFEINVAPLTIEITALFYKKMMAFAFPEKDPDSLEEDHDMDKKSKKKEKKKTKNTSFYVRFPGEKDDVEKMKERAERNHLFAYIKIPEVPIQFSFKGAKEKDQILDVANFQLQVPTLEYHDVTWTWFDLLLAIKSRYKDSLVAQAIKQKLMRSKAKSEGPEVPGEEEKVRLLLGRAVGQAPGSGRTSKRFFKK